MILCLLAKSESTYCPNKCHPEAVISWKLTSHSISCVRVCVWDINLLLPPSLKTSCAFVSLVGAKKLWTALRIRVWNVQNIMLHGPELLLHKSLNLAKKLQSCFSELNVTMILSVDNRWCQLGNTTQRFMGGLCYCLKLIGNTWVNEYRKNNLISTWLLALTTFKLLNWQ